MATNHERVGKALDLLKAGLGPFVAREFDNAYAAEAHAWAVALLGDGRAAPRVGRRGVAQADVERVARRLSDHAGPGRADAGERTARAAQPVGAPGAILRRRRVSGARFRGAAAGRGLGPAGGRSREDEDGPAAPAFRRAGAQPQAAGRRLAGRGRGQRGAGAVARGGDAARRRGRGALPAGRVRGRPVAGPSRRGGRPNTGTRPNSSAGRI